MAASMLKLLLTAPTVILLFFGIEANAHPHAHSNSTMYSNGGWGAKSNHTATKAGSALVSSALGSAHVLNNCTFQVGSNIVHGPRPGAPGPPEEYPSILQPGEHVSHPFLHDPGMGISWKLVRDDAGPVQLEWTWVPEQRRTYWDLSMIDAHTAEKIELVETKIKRQDPDATPAKEGIVHAFVDQGMSIAVLANNRDASMVQSGGNCVPVTCPRGSPVCTQAYNSWNDWVQQHDCAEHVDLKLTLCG